MSWATAPSQRGCSRDNDIKAGKTTCWFWHSKALESNKAMPMLARRLMLPTARKEWWLGSDGKGPRSTWGFLFFYFDGCFDGCHCNSQELTGIVVACGFCKGSFLQGVVFCKNPHYLHDITLLATHKGKGIFFSNGWKEKDPNCNFPWSHLGCI
jgi:hypothetical protein